MMASSSSSSSKPPHIPSPTKETKVESTNPPNWLDLPRHVTAKIVHNLGSVEILVSAQRVCSLWRDICKDPLMWRTIDMLYFPTYPRNLYNLERMCCHAIDRSCGQLVEINIRNLATDNLLKYIADSASRLRSLRFVSRWEISEEAFIQVVKKLPLLEELDISCSDLSKDSLKAIGRSCPLLKSLKFGAIDSHIPLELDDEAFAIAKTMPQLVNLQLFGSFLTDDGLLAILDGCPLLESLHLWACHHVYLRGPLAKRCVEQIKDFRLSVDYPSGFPDSDDPDYDFYKDLVSQFAELIKDI